MCGKDEKRIEGRTAKCNVTLLIVFQVFWFITLEKDSRYGVVLMELKTVVNTVLAVNSFQSQF